jgi:hypothetical protein
MRPSDPNNGGNAAPSGGEEPTGAAYVKITTVPSGPSMTASVPEKETGRMLKSAELVVGTSGTVIGPLVMAKTLELIGPGMPWHAQVALLTLAALLPMACYWMTVRRRRRRRD